MQLASRSQEDGACLGGTIANGNHLVKRFSPIAVQWLRLLFRDINAHFSHRPHGERSNMRGFCASAIGLEGFSTQMPEPALRHLRPGRIMRADKKNPLRHRCSSSSTVMSLFVVVYDNNNQTSMGKTYSR